MNENDIVKIEHGPCHVFTYKGQKALQIYGVHHAFSKLAHYKKFKTIIEIGADYGGLTNLLADHEISDMAEIYTFDINKQNFKKVAYRYNKIYFNHCDVFQYKGMIEEYINRHPGHTLLLCDGGNKAKEWETFAPMMKSGDIIMAHDYAPTEKEHNENIESGRWNWWEFSDACVKEQGFKKPLDCFEEYVWCIREKL